MGVKEKKMTLNYQYQYVLLYISGTADHIIEILIMISTGVFLYVFKKYSNVNIILFFIRPLNNY